MLLLTAHARMSSRTESRLPHAVSLVFHVGGSQSTAKMSVLPKFSSVFPLVSNKLTHVSLRADRSVVSTGINGR